MGLVIDEILVSVAANIDQLIAFVEAPSRMYPAGSRSTGHLLAAMNSIARYGVMGDIIAASSDPKFLPVPVADSSPPERIAGACERPF